MVTGSAAPGDQRLRGRVGIITGAASGIGAAGADLFAAHGAALVLLDQDRAGGQRVADAITARPGGVTGRRRGQRGRCHPGGAHRHGTVRETRPAVGQRRDGRGQDGAPDHAGGVEPGAGGQPDRRFLLAKYGLPELAADGGGTMVITGSANSFAADRSWAAYCASKGGLLMLCRALALDHAADGIRVNIVCPGSVTTPLHEDWLRGRPGGRPLPEVRDEDRAAHPLGRFADPAEVARAALFLSSAESQLHDRLAAAGGRRRDRMTTAAADYSIRVIEFARATSPLGLLLHGQAGEREIPYCYRCPLGHAYPGCGVACADDLERTILMEGPDSIAAFIAEPVIGSTVTGVVPVPEYYRRIREICDAYDVLFIADEVLTGYGRTGRGWPSSTGASSRTSWSWARGPAAATSRSARSWPRRGSSTRSPRARARSATALPPAATRCVRSSGCKVLRYAQEHGLFDAVAAKGL